ncbi:hypothetical protein J4G48_0015865 [Bradyrhizobium barranii subsp. apii]|uniref:hypothetical protein n=1 Tax=Bradyrhizobium barranii TaxID=2992140 RepID=UPI001AA14270|nr:hypothetical protein [Bradyrhizobium barranii]UPT99431.1 hypothetical protein J4G48_0015865 [Bradyrhizobium barranii subsp. apii]
MVETAAYVLEKGRTGTSTWHRLVSEDDKADALLKGANAYRVENIAAFEQIPTTPFVYWMPRSFLDLFASADKFERSDRNVRCGMGTLDDFRFVRNWWEVSEQSGWTPYAKGGDLSPFVTDIPAVVNFRDDGKEVKCFVEAKVGSASRKIQAESFYLRKGLQYGRRIRNPSPAILPAGTIFSDNANGIFIEGDNPNDLFAYLGLLNSDTAKAILTSVAPVRKMEVGYLQKMPIPSVGRENVELIEATRRSAKRSLSVLVSDETSRYFVHPKASLHIEDTTNEKVGDQEFGIPERDVEFLKAQSQVLAADGDDVDGDGDTDNDASEASGFGKLLSWAIGVAFGRFAKETMRKSAPEVDPFEVPPARSFGMGTSKGNKAVILVDDPGHPEDITARVANVLEGVGEEQIDAEELREVIARKFFADHLRMYSKTRRKSPIYWQLATRSASYSVWLYVHAFERDTLLQVQELIAHKLRHEQRELEAALMEANVAPRTSSSVSQKEAFVSELQSMYEEIKRVAPLWNPQLDDGIAINSSILWRLASHRGWQIELKRTWDALCQGDYDWSHLAMHLWPERVVSKCAVDRSIAIAHGLEHIFWFEDENGEWKAYDTPKTPIAQLVLDRTSVSVKAALKSLIEAPDVAAGTKRTRKSKAA